MENLLFFTCATKNYECFVVPYIYFASKFNEKSAFEIIVEDREIFLSENAAAIDWLENEHQCPILIRSIPKLNVQPKRDNTLRFILEPHTKREFVYIGDIDIMIAEPVWERHKHVFDAGLPYSNVVRSNTKRLTGLHLARFSAQYPLPEIDDIIATTDNDEETLYKIMDRKGMIYDSNTYRNIVKSRPLHGIHLSPNRLPFFTHKLHPSWDISYKDAIALNRCIQNDFSTLEGRLSAPSRLALCNLIFLTSGISNFSESEFNALTTQAQNKQEYVRANTETNTKSKFSEIYEKNLWGSSESKSGPSSTLKRTEQIRTNLPILMKRHGFRTIVDAPCGDLNWMQHLISSDSFDRYIGCDIVDNLIQENAARFASRSDVEFHSLDIIRDKLPSADVLLCRDCLFHFSYADIQKFLQNFANSEIKFLLTTSHKNRSHFSNKDIDTGSWRWLDLFLPPISLPREVVDQIPDGDDRDLFLFSRQQIKQHLVNFL